MRVYISVDMEGCAGVVHREHTNPVGYDYELARRYMTAEANAAVEGALAAGAAEVVVSDSHGGNGMRSILPHDLHPEAQLIMGSPRPLGQIEGIEAGFDALFLVGYHVRHGAFGVLNHTTNGQAVDRLCLNGLEVGEIGLNAIVAGHFGVPVAMVSGDAETVAEAHSLLPWVRGATVKWTVSRYAARMLSPARARAVIRDSAFAALRDLSGMKAYRLSGPITLEVRFKETGTAEKCLALSGVEPVDGCTVRVQCPDAFAAYRTYTSLVEMFMPAWGNWIRGGR